jgi:hypothetical protein
MSMAFTAIKQRPAMTADAGFASLGRRMLSCLIGNCRAPDTGVPPHGMHISRRGWKRNSALVMSLYEQRRT